MKPLKYKKVLTIFMVLIGPITMEYTTAMDTQDLYNTTQFHDDNITIINSIRKNLTNENPINDLFKTSIQSINNLFFDNLNIDKTLFYTKDVLSFIGIFFHFVAVPFLKNNLKKNML